MNLWLSGFALTGEGRTRTIAVLPEGVWHTDKYGELDLSASVIDAILAAYDAGMPSQGVFIDVDHDFGESRGRVTALARGTYTDPVTSETLPCLAATVEFTEEGAALVDSGKYGYVSAAFGPMTDVRDGTKYEYVLRAISLTNSPVLGNLGPIGQGVGIAASETQTLVCLGDVLDEMRRAKQPTVPADKQAAAWGMWDATGAFERLVREAVAEGLEGDELKARIGELAADLPEAVMEAIAAAVEDANAGDGYAPAADRVPQADPTLSDTGDDDDPVAALMSRFDALMTECDGIVKGTAGVRSMRALATETRKKLEALLTKKGGTTKMTDEEIQAMQAENDRLARELSERTRSERTAKVEAVLAKFSAAGLAEPARKALSAILLADGDIVTLSDKETPINDALTALTDSIEFVPVEKPDDKRSQPQPVHEDTELAEARAAVRAQMGTEPTE